MASGAATSPAGPGEAALSRAAPEAVATSPAGPGVVEILHPAAVVSAASRAGRILAAADSGKALPVVRRPNGTLPRRQRMVAAASAALVEAAVPHTLMAVMAVPTSPVVVVLTLPVAVGADTVAVEAADTVVATLEEAAKAEATVITDRRGREDV
jgi:hypothetical protein